MTEEKWKIVGGSVYRLAEVFEGMIEAVSHAKELKKNIMYSYRRQKMAVGQYIGDRKNQLLNANPSITMYNSNSRCLIVLDNT